ncbi:unnamed protein product [Lymnaea stagnalis]|uniref:Ig-like domain-containing protein n=1 Tax=Lymnaea stagnalis TaxID=6523 RepID=A0AAV2HKM9_LYMST
MDHVRILLMTFLVTTRDVLVTSSRHDLGNYGLSPLTATDVTGHLDKSATLRCQLQTGAHNRGWFVITWQKLENAGGTIPLVHLPVSHKVPEWSQEIPPGLQTRLQPIITVQPNHVEFNIVISNVTCSDEGEYRCIAVTPQGEVISSAELTIIADSGEPEIMNKYLPNLVHGLVTLECRANVGLPERMLLWYSKEPGTGYFTMLENQRDLVQETDGCHVVSTRSVDVIISTATRGTRFRCGYPGFIEKSGMYDEIVHEMEETAPQLSEVRVEPKMASSCEGPSCRTSQVEQAVEEPNEDNSATSLHPWLPIVYLFCLTSNLIYALHYTSCHL